MVYVWETLLAGKGHFVALGRTLKRVADGLCVFETNFMIRYNINDGTCWMKNASILTATTASTSDTHSALTTNFQISTDISCPYTNGTDQTTSDGMKFQILCGQNMPLNDYCPIGSPKPQRADGLCPYHAESLSDCMQICATSAPLCKAVVWNPDMTGGYGNCYPKTDVSPANYAAISNAPPEAHMAVAINIPTLDESCTNGTTTKASNGADFEISCNDNRASNDIQQVHAENITACLDACSTFNNSTAGKCSGAMYDSTMASGWRNCWLKSVEGTKQTVLGNVFALKTGTSSGSGESGNVGGVSDSGASEPSSDSSTSKAWVAGAVIGPLVGVALIGLTVWYFRRRRATSQTSHQLSELPTEAALPAYAKEKGASETFHELGNQRTNTPPQSYFQHEADSGQVHELPASTK
jgi:hypothetical protein